ncbi:MAG: hypothetical protein JXN64_02135 [Spirochaetes bacterium]|nr:hypothetical protein [Spirochaetota bacterium]
MKFKSSAAVAGIAGGIGGLINAALCYAKWPVPVMNNYTSSFDWHVIPAGFIHGLVLALIAVLAAGITSRRTRVIRWLIIPFAGWFAGYLSWIPLDMSAFGNSLRQAVSWPVEASWRAVWSPFAYFGIVAALLYSWLIFRPGKTVMWQEMLAAGWAGILGSLWWWISWETWYFSLIHGAIWGCVFGAAMSLSGGLNESRSIAGG